jgi:hypothetical protein
VLRGDINCPTHMPKGKKCWRDIQTTNEIGITSLVLWPNGLNDVCLGNVTFQDWVGGSEPVRSCPVVAYVHGKLI